ncbi:ATP-dependent zinc protease [Candidatus Saccharibacteria bacterium]|nr:ATP-dependent zinc protease [Candidatus Saccharibacteria bacterium]
MEYRLTLGSLETVAIPSLGIPELVAKVDTGAFSGALHCTDISLMRGDDGRTLLYFTPLGEPSLATSTGDFKAVTVRSANGQEEDRYLIPITVTVQGTDYDTYIGLTDRISMKHDMLLGRRFMIEQNALVDVMLTKDIDTEAEGFGL